MRYSQEMRERLAAEAVGKTIKSLEYVEDPPHSYWVMEFTDGSEISFCFMAEIHDILAPLP